MPNVSITPHLVCQNAEQAVELYQKAFAAEVHGIHKMPDGKVMHAHITIGGAPVFLCDEFEGGNKSPRTLGGTPVVINLEVDDCDAWYARAVAAGCEGTMEPADQFWGARFAAAADPFGHKWTFSTQTREVSPEELEAAVKAMTESSDA